jgi:hypothetical protein
MSKDFVQFLTPGPLTESCRFSTRVFTSWIVLGLGLGLVLGIIGLSSGAAATTTGGAGALLVNCLFGIPVIICLFGLIGLGIDAARGRRSEYAGWYWWLFPIVTYIVIGFWFAFMILAFAFALAGVNLPKPRYNPPSGRKRVNVEQAKEQIRQEVKRKQSKKFLDEFEQTLLQLQQEEMQRLEREHFEEKEKKERIEALSIRERILMKIRENPGALLEDILTEDEMEELALMILEASL